MGAVQAFVARTADTAGARTQRSLDGGAEGTEELRVARGGKTEVGSREYQ
jgi:hypothetical protein